MECIIRNIKHCDQQAVYDLHYNHYWRSHCLLLNENFYRWQFIEPPESVIAGGDQSIVAFDKKGHLLSYLGIVPMKVLFKGEYLQGAHLISWLSSPASRGKGVGMKVMQYAVDRFDFLFGRSVTPAALTIYQKLGFRYFKNSGRWIAIIDSDATIGLAVNQSDINIKRCRLRAINLEEIPPLFHTSEVPNGVSNLLIRRVLSNDIAFERTEEYLRWRYEKHPFLDYTFLLLNDPKMPKGFAVVRVEQVGGRIGKVLRILEFIAPREFSRHLSIAILAYGYDQECAYADIFGISEHFLSGFVSVGGFNVIEEPEIRLPYLLQPWDPDVLTPGLLFFGKKNISDMAGIGPVDDISRIYISKGDGNMDWPSWIPSANGISIAPPTKLAKIE